LDSKKKGDESSDSSEENGDQPVDAVVAEAMKKAGVKGMENLFAMTDQQILALPGIGKAKLARIRATQQSQVEA
jgi:DNA-directed RNA polymerase alpha subunit